MSAEVLISKCHMFTLANDWHSPPFFYFQVFIEKEGKRFCKAYGDPHIVTFDGLRHSLFYVGDYLMMAGRFVEVSNSCWLIIFLKKQNIIPKHLNNLRFLSISCSNIGIF